MQEKRTKFLTFVYLSALAHDSGRASKDAQFIAQYAARIPPEQIPDDPIIAAMDLVKAFEGGKNPRWMIIPKVSTPSNPSP